MTKEQEEEIERAKRELEAAIEKEKQAQKEIEEALRRLSDARQAGKA